MFFLKNLVSIVTMVVLPDAHSKFFYLIVPNIVS